MTSMGVDWDRIRRERGRLVILKALAEQTNGTLDSSMIEEIMPLFAIRESRQWIHEQMEYLAQHHAIQLTTAGTVMIATLKTLGKRHLSRDDIIIGVTRPSEPGV